MTRAATRRSREEMTRRGGDDTPWWDEVGIVRMGGMVQMQQGYPPSPSLIPLEPWHELIRLDQYT